MEFHDNYPQYELMAHHSEEAGVKKRKKLWGVFWIMLVITIVELAVGMLYDGVFPKPLWYIISFLIFTVLKAYFIVYKFMHLGDEVTGLKWTIIAPYTLFVIYLVWIIANEGVYSSHPSRKPALDPNIVQQIKSKKEAHGHGADHSDDKENDKKEEH
jgi:cytochrome c oxidase subunit IV